MRRCLILLPLLLAGCIPHGRPQQHAARTVAPMPALSDKALRQCHADLGRAGVSFQVLPDRMFAGGCDATAAVKLIDIGTPVTDLGAMRCPLALAFARWVQEVAQPRAQAAFGQPVRRIESFGTYACRPVNGVAGARLSEHAHANTVDVAAFVLADGRRITVREGWDGTDAPTRDFLRAVHDGACRRFGVVLGPDANAYHRDHLHFDLASTSYCR